MTTQQAFQKRGYVNDLFRIFHLDDLPKAAIPPHFHDFRKIVILLEGNIFYDIEGTRYALESGDMVLIDAGEVHRPVFPAEGTFAYNRLIIYFSDQYFQQYADSDLALGFRLVKQGGSHVIHGNALPRRITMQSIPSLYAPLYGTASQKFLLQQCRLTEFMLFLSLALKKERPVYSEPVTQNKMIQELMAYLTAHLTEEMSIDSIAEHMHLTRSYLMHTFKAEAGCTILSYITEKRLYYAQNLIESGVSITDACYNSGFTNYTSFFRAYKKRYGHSPRRSNFESAAMTQLGVD